MYKYKMVQVPPTITIKAKDNRSGLAAEYLENVVNEWAYQGWEFHRVDTIGIQKTSGLLGRKVEYDHYYVISFRKAITS
ncbi:hypothetical protein [Budvicia aquatica]|uniref:DUF4177 domain-containing protein n=1 Tax=Budvicia aquatica TaxID=82979 RepID=A0A2C6DRT9_9GAMM|nr:hypothetical protein [Budvicia aquatica]PHI31531.1 DUF4177 domain-containing protein [Budvicia aquatica]VFS51986.1 Uncharacterised protein [Budvicia aquatica]